MTISNKRLKITADNYTLNTISRWCFAVGRMYEAEGYKALSSEAFEFAQVVYDELEKTGYFNRINN